ncbi:MAG: N-acetylmuramoyl-L-alanine amidase [Rhizobiales bacterium]|nr:N-acetylmuramoyl-L-alanine amidase [Hyphomicrobiales bacterium]
MTGGGIRGPAGMRIVSLFIAALLLAAGSLGLGAVSAQTGQRATALDARLAGDANRTRIVIDLNRKIEVRSYTIANPNRVVIELPEVSFDLPVGAGKQARGLVSAFRYGQFAQGKGRIVIDLREPARIDKTFVLAAIDDQPARLVIDLVRTDAASFLKGALVPEPAKTAALRPQVKPQGSDTRPLIVIDPGHGGPDSGAQAKTGDEEKEVVLDVGKRLRDQLLKTNRYRVVMTRDDDYYVPLDERVAIARTNNAALFISIHADSLSKGAGEASGATIYTLSERASDSDAQKLADKENDSDKFAGYLARQPDDIANILFDLAQRNTKNHSALFARTLVGSIKGAARLHKSPLRSAGFVVLKSPDVPSVLLELGYLSSPDDLKQMTSETWREKVSATVVVAIEKFFADRAPAIAGR